MTDPAGITQRGAERSAPRSRWGASPSDAHGIARTGAHLVTSHAGEQPVGLLHREPPNARLHVESRSTIAKRDADNRSSARVRGTVERDAEVVRGVVVAPRGVRRIRAELSPEGCRTASRAIACLTSASGDRDPRHVRVEPPRVVVGSSVGACQRAGVAVEGVARSLKGGVE